MPEEGQRFCSRFKKSNLSLFVTYYRYATYFCFEAYQVPAPMILKSSVIYIQLVHTNSCFVLERLFSSFDCFYLCYYIFLFFLSRNCVNVTYLVLRLLCTCQN